MRAVFPLHFLTALLLVAGPALGRAQTTGSATKSAAKAAATTKKHHTVHAAESATRAKAGTAATRTVTGKATPPPTLGTPVTDMPALAPVAPVPLRDAPDGRSLATLAPGVTLEAVARDRGWVRVRAEGWVKESEVAPVDSARVVLSAADLRADPDGARGKHVRWDVEVLAMATADPLRKGLNPDEPYLLARGPGSESALLYVAIPPALVTAARALASLAPVPVTLAATVRVGRSDPVGVPILDAQSLTRR